MNIQTKDGTMYEFAPTSNKRQIRANYLLVCEHSRHNQLQKARREIAGNSINNDNMQLTVKGIPRWCVETNLDLNTYFRLNL